MKRNVFLFIFLAVLSINIFYFSSAEIITGRATSQVTSLSVTVVVPSPSISIIKPENETYLSNNVMLNYSASNVSSAWYNIDNSVNTSTSSSPIYLNLSEGTHIIKLYANNTDGLQISRNVTFHINTTIFEIEYDSFGGETKGETTNFSQYSYEDIQNLSNVILENTLYGKINFLEPINLTDIPSVQNGNLDLDKYINISNNRIEINSSALENLNKTAKLNLYNLSFSNPSVLKDGILCSVTICVEESYSSGDFVFNVTHFTTYSAEEASVSLSPGTSGSGGSGSSSSTKISGSISLSVEEISVSLKPGETKNEYITITNNKNTKTHIDFEVLKIEQFIKIVNSSFDLEAGESRKVEIDFLANKNTEEDVYVGKIIVKSDGEENEILVALGVSSESSLFDININIPEEFREIDAGGEILAYIELTNFGDTKITNAELEYIIENEDRDVVLREKETIVVDKQTNVIKTFVLPDTAGSGPYLLRTTIYYSGKSAVATSWFKVKKSSFISKNLLIGIIILLIAILIIIIIYAIIRKNKSSKENIKNESKKKKIELYYK